MAIVKIDTSKLIKYFDSYTVDGAFLRYGSSFRKELSREANEELDRLESFKSTVFVREELAKFEKEIEYANLKDVEILYLKLRDEIHNSSLMFSLNYPVKQFAQNMRELFQLKILYYVITITNSDLPDDEFDSHIIMSNLSYSSNLYSEQQRIRICLNNAFCFLKRWNVTFEKYHYTWMLYNNYREQVYLMAKEAGIDTRTEKEKRREKIVQAKDNTIEIVLKILGFFLIVFIMSLIFNGWEGTFG